MKKTRALLLSILLIILAFTSCNLDGTSGIFRQIAQSKAPLSIRYEKLLGYDATATYHYYWISKGIYRFDSSKTQELVAAKPDGDKIHGAALYSADDKVFYITNDEDELSNGTIRFIDTGTKALGTVPITSSIITLDLEVKNLYANSMILVKGKDGAGEKVFELLKYNGTTAFDTSVATFTLPTTEYGLHAVIQQTTKEQNSLGTDSAMLVSFVKPTGPSTGDYEHYLVTGIGTKKKLITNTIQVANFLYDSTINENIYVLSTNGKLYYAGTYTSPAPWVEMSDSGKPFDKNAFAYKVVDGTDYHLITKPSLKTSPLVVFTFPRGTTTSAGVSFTNVQSGYAKELSLATIVSAQEKLLPPGVKKTLLVATHENGMYDITINKASANVDSSSNGSSSAAEEYSF